MAGATLAIFCGFGIPLIHQIDSEITAAHEVNERQAEFAKADTEHKEYVAASNARRATVEQSEKSAQAEFTSIESEFQTALAKAREQVESKQFIVRLTGPERAQPGAPNDWRVDMYRRNGMVSLPGKVDWVVKDQTGAVLFSDSQVAAGKAEPPTVRLPVSFWEKVKPDSDLTLEVTAYEANLNAKSKVQARVPLAQPVFITQLATDKPLYKPGETVYFRSLTLDRATFTPPEKNVQIEYRMTKPGAQPEAIAEGSARGFFNPVNGAEVLGPDKKPLRGIGCGAYELPPNCAGRRICAHGGRCVASH